MSALATATKLVAVFPGHSAKNRSPFSVYSPASASVPPVTDLRSAGDVVRRRNVLTILGLVAALAGPWPGAMPVALAQAPDTLAKLDGRWVRSLDIVSRTIFDPPPEQGRGVYVLANRLHVRTRPATVRGALVFREGSLWSESGRAESERQERAGEGADGVRGRAAARALDVDEAEADQRAGQAAHEDGREGQHAGTGGGQGGQRALGLGHDRRR